LRRESTPVMTHFNKNGGLISPPFYSLSMKFVPNRAQQNIGIKFLMKPWPRV
jgi:hypothetical protein